MSWWIHGMRECWKTNSMNEAGAKRCDCEPFLNQPGAATTICSSDYQIVVIRSAIALPNA